MSLPDYYEVIRPCGLKGMKRNFDYDFKSSESLVESIDISKLADVFISRFIKLLPSDICRRYSFTNKSVYHNCLITRGIDVEIFRRWSNPPEDKQIFIYENGCLIIRLTDMYYLSKLKKFFNHLLIKNLIYMPLKLEKHDRIIDQINKKYKRLYCIIDTQEDIDIIFELDYIYPGLETIELKFGFDVYKVNSKADKITVLKSMLSKLENVQIVNLSIELVTDFINEEELQLLIQYLEHYLRHKSEKILNFFFSYTKPYPEAYGNQYTRMIYDGQKLQIQRTPDRTPASGYYSLPSVSRFSEHIVIPLNPGDYTSVLEPRDHHLLSDYYIHPEIPPLHGYLPPNAPFFPSGSSRNHPRIIGDPLPFRDLFG